jgi:hypothetical protein
MGSLRYSVAVCVFVAALLERLHSIGGCGANASSQPLQGRERLPVCIEGHSLVGGLQSSPAYSRIMENG